MRPLKKIVFFFLCTVSTATMAQICFNPITNYQVGVFSCSIVTADFNNDGNPDLATANNYGNTVSILLGSSAGTYSWSANPYLGAGTAPLWITTADYNLDGYPDIATANNGNHTVSVLFGNGNGTSWSTFSFATPGEASALTSGDFDGDGLPDLAVTNAHYDSVSIHLNTGSNSFTFKSCYDSGAFGEPDEVVTADVNEDGILDLVVDNWNGSIAVMPGDGTGAFPTLTTYTTTGIKSTCAVTADFNLDGHLDIVACNYFSNDISFLAGNGTGTFSPCVNYPCGGIKPYTLWADDINGDGKPDVVTCNETSNNISVLLGDGMGGFGSPSVFAAGTNTEQAITGDFNGDGATDIAAANFGSNNVTVFLNAPPPPVVANATSDTICAGNSVTLYGSGAQTYTWTNGVNDGAAFSPTVTATYTVTGATSAGCTNWDTISVVVNICTDLEGHEISQASVYPQPAANYLIIESAKTPVSIVVKDMVGRELKKETQPSVKTQIPLLDLPAGMYFIECNWEGRKQVFPLIKQAE